MTKKWNLTYHYSKLQGCNICLRFPLSVNYEVCELKLSVVKYTMLRESSPCINTFWMASAKRQLLIILFMVS